MRERLPSRLLAHFQRRITPARAGKTFQKEKPLNYHWDHPRSCGKDSFLTYPIRTTLGSPPLVRERRLHPQDSDLPFRITPARAGKTSGVIFCLQCVQDHPRSCGKDIRQFREFANIPGSPPLVRERLDEKSTTLQSSRITPARAGKTCRLN